MASDSSAERIYVAPSAKIEADVVELGDGCWIDEGVSISARSVKIGRGARIEHGTVAKALKGRMDRFDVGDYSFVGFNNRILCPSFSMGDYSQLHNSGLHSGYQALSIGHNCWIGQSSILNCTQTLSIGNNIGIGTQSQLWTHVASGELLGGCTLFGEHPLILEDDVWVVGGAVISPGLRLGHHSVIMTGSVLTKSTEPYHTYAGVPAKDVTDKISVWKPVSLDDKVAMMRTFVAEFEESNPQFAGRVVILDEPFSGKRDEALQDKLVVARSVDAWPSAAETGTVVDLTTKTYVKTHDPLEVSLLKFLCGYRAKFLPRYLAENATER